MTDGIGEIVLSFVIVFLCWTEIFGEDVDLLFSKVVVKVGEFLPGDLDLDLVIIFLKEDDVRIETKKKSSLDYSKKKKIAKMCWFFSN